MDVSLGSGAMGSLLVLQATQADRAQAEAQLASGLRVSRPLDNPAAFFDASALRARAGALESTLDAIGVAKSGITAAVTGLEAGRKMLETLRYDVERFQQYLPGPSEFDRSVSTRGGLSADTQINTLDDDPSRPGIIPNNRVLQVQVRNRTNGLVERANFRLDTVGAVNADNPGASIPTYYSRTVGQLVDDINASPLGLSARLEDGQIKFITDDADEHIRFAGSREMIEAFHLQRIFNFGGETNPPTGAPARIVSGTGGLTLDTDVSTLPGGVTNGRYLRFSMNAPDSPRGYTESRVYFRQQNVGGTMEGRRDFGGRTVGEMIGFINDVLPGLTASLEGGHLVIEGDSRGIYLDGSNQMLTAFGLERGTYWGGPEEAPKRIVGTVTGLTASSNAPSSVWLRDGVGNVELFRRGNPANPARHGYTMGEFITRVNDLNEQGLLEMKAGFTDDGRLYLEGTKGNFLPRMTGNTLRAAGLQIFSTTNPNPPGGLPVMPESSPSLTQGQWDDFQALGDTLGQYDSILSDSSVSGANFAAGSPASVHLNERGTTYRVGDHVGLISNRIGLDKIEIWDLTDQESLDETLDKIDGALARIDVELSRLSTDLVVLETREDFNRGIIINHLAGADALTLADQNEAGAKLLAADTRQQLAFNSLTLTAQADRSVLRLFG